MVRNIAAGRDATAPMPDGTDSVVKVMQSPTAQDPLSIWEKHAEDVKRELSYGRSVLITGYCHAGPCLSFDANSVCVLARRDIHGAPIEFHCKFLESSVYITYLIE